MYVSCVLVQKSKAVAHRQTRRLAKDSERWELEHFAAFVQRCFSQSVALDYFLARLSCSAVVES